MEQLQNLNAELSEQVSANRKKDLQDEMVSINRDVDSLKDKTKSRIDELHEIDRRWNDFYQQLDQFAEWLNEKESDLADVHHSDVSPQEQLSQAEVISDIFQLFF